MNAIAPAVSGSSAPTTPWALVQQFMLRHTGNVLRDDQAYLLESRLARPIKTLGFQSVNDFVIATCTGTPKPDHIAVLIDALTTHETMFFRDLVFWKQIREITLPALFDKARSGRQIRIWCAACSTGQEPYSLAMLIREFAPDLAARFEIIASDISEVTIKHAKDGFFSALETNRGLDLRHLAKFFQQAPGGFRAKDELRNAIRFQQHNLLGATIDPSSCDMVWCRNVLIYFSESDRDLVIKRLLRALTPNGIFGLGSTESCREPGLQNIAAGLYRKS